jgi:hypothetical protein
MESISSNLHVHCNNQGVVKLSHNPLFHQCTKLIEVYHHFVKERVLAGKLIVHYIPIEEIPLPF